MKKILSIFLLLLYASSSFGMTLHFHYCCGKLKKVDFAVHTSHDCGSCKGQKMKGSSCCVFKEVRLKIKTDQGEVKLFPSFLKYFSAPQAHFNYVPIALMNGKTIPRIFAPPTYFKNLNTLHCIYRI